MLAAAVGAAGDVQLELLFEAGKALFEFVSEPAGEALCFGERELAEFRAGAGDCAARESGSLHGQARGGEFAATSEALSLRHVDDEQVLHDGVANVAVGVAIGEVGGEIATVAG